MALDLGGQPIPQSDPVRVVHQPVPRDRFGGSQDAHRQQVGAPDQPAAAQFAGAVRAAGQSGEFGGTGPAGATPGQPGRSYVQDGGPAGRTTAARFAQHRAVADPQGQSPGEGEAGGVVAERTDGDGHGGGADVQGDRTGQAGDRLPGDPDVEHIAA
ncbi:hypothetical protein [Streptomyces roseochromogenus]|uniref:hypothetical protein n=1 Tax=Streptomyces roseochromogenus TaxID=285450 RepID=UPI001FD76BF3|nr:hypothetical protein [Streptomyces roseochromogenus]